MIHRKAVNNRKLINKQHKERNNRKSGESPGKAAAITLSRNARFSTCLLKHRSGTAFEDRSGTFPLRGPDSHKIHRYPHKEVSSPERDVSN